MLMQSLSATEKANEELEKKYDELKKKK